MFLHNPQKILQELNKYVIGQEEAKKSLIKTLVFNIGRLSLKEEDRKEIKKKNVLLIGPTGSGKTEIARKLSEILGLPFCRVSATSFTLAGYKGNDPEDIISKYLYNDVKANYEKYSRNYLRIEAARRARERVEEYIEEKEIERILDKESEEARRLLAEELDLVTSNTIAGNSIREDVNLFEIFEGRESKESEEDRLRKEISRIFYKYFSEELKKLNRSNRPYGIANRKDLFKTLMESSIIFIDEFDKIFLGAEDGNIKEFYSELQKQLLTLVEGCTVNIENEEVSQVSTEDITFIGAGTFENVDSDRLIPELKGRFPVKIRLNKLSYKDYRNILEKSKGGIIYFCAIYPYLNIKITKNALNEMARICDELNKKEYLGARRIDQIEQVLFDYVSDLIAFGNISDIKIDRRTIRKLTSKLFNENSKNTIKSLIGFI